MGPFDGGFGFGAVLMGHSFAVVVTDGRKEGRSNPKGATRRLMLLPARLVRTRRNRGYVFVC